MFIFFSIEKHSFSMEGSYPSRPSHFLHHCWTEARHHLWGSAHQHFKTWSQRGHSFWLHNQLWLLWVSCLSVKHKIAFLHSLIITFPLCPFFSQWLQLKETRLLHLTWWTPQSLWQRSHPVALSYPGCRPLTLCLVSEWSMSSLRKEDSKGNPWFWVSYNFSSKDSKC